jgi:hypothetical protein
VKATVQINQLWQEHLRDAFPSGCAGTEIDGVDLVLLDADTAGLVSHVVGGATLSPVQTRILRKLIADFDRVLPQLPSHAQSYFARLATIARAL